MSAARFQREVQLTAHLQHPHILPIHGAGARDGLLYYVMPYIEGESVRHRLEREGRLSVSDVVRVLREVADALACAHRQGVVHRDIKPENILLEEGHAVLADFGIARALEAARVTADGPREPLTATGAAVGTPGYMAPEQLAGEPNVDARSDIYALAVVGYETLTGRRPFASPSAQAALVAHLTEAARPVAELRPDTPPEVSAAIAKALAKDPAHRFATAAEFRDALEPPARASMSSRRRTVWLVTSAVLLAVLATGSVLAGRMRARDSVGEAVAVRSLDSQARAPDRSVAVLPFVNLSSDPENEYFSDGMTEELIAALAKIEELRVPSRATVFAFKGRRLSARQVGDSLRVGAVLQGSVQRTGDRIRVMAQLVSVAADSQLWAHSFDRELDDVFAVQDEIARAIVDALRIELTGRSAAELLERPTHSVAAYDLYVKGRYLLRAGAAGEVRGLGAYQGTRDAEARVRRAIEHFEQAIAQDSSFALAYAGLARGYITLTEYVPPRGLLPKVKAAALRALEIDSSLVETRLALGDIRLVYDRDWSAAETEYRRALTLQPNSADAHWSYFEFLLMSRRFDEALGELQKVLRIRRQAATDTVAFMIEEHRALGSYYHFHREYDRAIEHFRSALAYDPAAIAIRWRLGLVLTDASRHAEAIKELEQVRDETRGALPMLSHLGLAYTRAGRRAEALAILRELERRATRQYFGKTQFAPIYLELGDKDRAIEWAGAGLRGPPLVAPLGERGPRVRAASLGPAFRSAA